MQITNKNLAIAALAAAGGFALGEGSAFAQDTYVVQPGDSLASIARGLGRADVTWRSLCSINFETLSDCDTLEVGLRIRLSERDTSTQSADGSAGADIGAAPSLLTRPSPRPDTDNLPPETEAEGIAALVLRPEPTPTEQEPIPGAGGAVDADPSETGDGDPLTRFDLAMTGATGTSRRNSGQGETAGLALSEGTNARPSDDEQTGTMRVAAADGAPADGSVARAARSLGDGALTEESSLPDTDARVTLDLAYGPEARPMEFRSFHMHEIAREDDGAVRLAGHVAGLYSTGTTGGAFLRVEDEFEALAAGSTLRVSVTMSGSEDATAGLAYSTNDLGNSGWHLFDLTEAPSTHSFEYEVPPLVHGQGDFLGVDPDPEGLGHSVVIHGILFEILERDAAQAPELQ